MIRRAKRGRLYLVASPTYTLLADTTLRMFRQVSLELEAADGDTFRSMLLRADDMRASPPSFRLGTGAEIIFRSAEDPERLRGPNLSGAWLDEASLMDRDAYNVIIACLREKGEQGWLSATFTPKGLSHWTYEVFGQPRANNSISHATTLQNPFNPKGFYDTLKLEYSGLLAQQELDGQFVNVEGAEWPADYFGADIWFDTFPDTSRIVVRVLALDPSKGKDAKHGDYSALVRVDLDKDGMLWIEADLARRPTPRIVEDGIGLCRVCKPDAFAIEINQFQELLGTEFLRRATELGIHLPLFGLNNTINKNVRIRTLGPYLAQSKMRFKAGSPGTKLLVDQLRDFPVGEFDDGADSLEMGIRMLNHLLGERIAGSQPELMRAG